MFHDYKGKILPIYPLTEGLNQNILRKAIQDALEKYRLDIENEIPLWAIKERNLINKREALLNVHFPQDFKLYSNAKKTFIYEEFFFQRLFLLKRKEALKKITKKRNPIHFKYKELFIQSLPFKLTDYQEKAIKEIENDLFSDYVFSRLLQGDVSSGKTIVALISILSAVESGCQCAFMVPTEVLALQHYKVISKFLEKQEIKIVLLKGLLSKSEKNQVLNSIATGEAGIIIGTHSLFSDDVVYKNLGFAVIDEQQRFGVEQRYQLLSKGESCDLLLMTATPIPRSLAMSLYGDLEITVMKGIIQGRKSVKTWLIDDNDERIERMHTWIKDTVREKGRVIFVYSLIEASEKSDNKDLTTQYTKLKKIYNYLSF